MKKHFNYSLLAISTLAGLSGCGGGDTAIANAAKPAVVALIDCPKFRDLVVGPPLASTCWIVENQGKKYSLSGAVGTPQLGHKILVEATDSGSTDTFCGGQVLSNVRVSVLPEIDNSCQTVLPAEGVTLPAPAPFAPPTLSTEPATPYVPTRYMVLYPYQSSQIGTGLGSIPFFAEVEKAAKLALRANAKALVITGSAANTILNDGSTAVESADIALERATKVSTALQILGVPKSLITVNVSPVIPSIDGANAWMARSVAIEVRL